MKEQNIYTDNQVTDLFIDLYNKQKEYLVDKDLDILNEFDLYIGNTPIKYDKKDFYSKICTYSNLEQCNEVYYTVDLFKDLIKIFNIENADIWSIVFDIERRINYYELDKKIINEIFNELNITDLESLHRTINYYELDAPFILSDKLIYNVSDNYIEGKDLINNLIDEYKKEYAYLEILSENINEEVSDITTEYLTEKLKQQISKYNKFNVKCNIKALYRYQEYLIR